MSTPLASATQSLDSSVVIAVIALLGSIGGAVLSYRAASQANVVNARKVDSEAFERSQVLYERLLAEMEKALNRTRDQVERLNTQLCAEQEVSNMLRSHVRSLQAQVDAMEQNLSTVHTQLRRSPRAAPEAPPAPPQPDR